MLKLKEFISKNKLNLLLIFLWAVIVIITAFHHELWFDSLLADILVKSKSINIIINEVHPLLWYILQVPFVVIGFPEYPIQLIAFIFMFLAVCYFMLKSPFNIFIKCLFIFNCGMLYLIPVIARNYSLIPIFLFMLAGIYKDRHTKPILYAILIVLLSQTHVTAWCFCFIISLLFIIEVFSQKILNDSNFDKRKNIISVFIILLNFLFILIYFKNLILNHSDFIHFEHLTNQQLECPSINQALFSIPSIMGLENISLYVFLAAVITLYICIFYINKKTFIILFFTTFSFIVLFNYVYCFAGVPLQKVFCIFLFLIFSCWILEKNNKILWIIKEISLYIILIIVFLKPLSFPIVMDDINNSFSNYLKLEKFLKNNIDMENGEQVLFLFDENEGNYWSFHFIEYYMGNSLVEYSINNIKIDNNFIDNYIKENNLSIKYVVIFRSLYDSIDLEYPYVFKFDTDSNNVSLLAYDNLKYQENFYKVFEKVEK